MSGSFQTAQGHACQGLFVCGGSVTSGQLLRALSRLCHTPKSDHYKRVELCILMSPFTVIHLGTFVCLFVVVV